jgi:hypothetical protein
MAKKYFCAINISDPADDTLIHQDRSDRTGRAGHARNELALASDASINQRVWP